MNATAPNNAPRLLTVREVAERLQMNRWTVYRKVERGEIGAVKLGYGRQARVRIPEDELERFLYGDAA